VSYPEDQDQEVIQKDKRKEIMMIRIEKDHQDKKKEKIKNKKKIIEIEEIDEKYIKIF
jgi:hypothetical protein